jgi:VCBS repeat-containing protein
VPSRERLASVKSRTLALEPLEERTLLSTIPPFINQDIDSRWPAINDHGDIVYCEQVDGGWQVFLNGQQITDNNLDSRWPAIANDGTIVYHHGYDSGGVDNDPIENAGEVEARDHHLSPDMKIIRRSPNGAEIVIEDTYWVGSNWYETYTSAGIASDGTIISASFWSGDFKSRFRVSGVGLLPDNVHFGNHPDINASGDIVYLSDGSIHKANVSSPYPGVVVGSGVGRINDHGDIVAVTGEVRILPAHDYTQTTLVDNGTWADINNRKDVVFEKVDASGICQIYLFDADLPDIDLSMDPNEIALHPDPPDKWKSDHKMAGGVDITYTVTGTLPTSAPLFLSWATGPTLAEAVGTPIPTGPSGTAGDVETSADTYHVHVPADQLGIAPSGARYLVVMADPTNTQHPDGVINEANEGNNLAYLELSDDVVLKNSVTVSHSGPRIEATFTPASGALTLGQAAALTGVERFNWDQTISLPQGSQGFGAFEVTIPERYFRIVPETGQFAPYLKNWSGGLVAVNPIDETDTMNVALQELRAPTWYDPAPQLSLPLLTTIVWGRRSEGEIEGVVSLPDCDPKTPGWDPPDGNTPYFNWNSQLEEFEKPDGPSPNRLRFSDEPSIGAGTLQTGQWVTYRTQLSGLDAVSGKSKLFWNKNVNFTWNSNAVNIENVNLFQATGDVSLTIASGGVFGVAFGYAPEAINDSGAGFTTDKGTAFTTDNVLANDINPDDADGLTVRTIDTSSTLGLVKHNGDGTFDYDPNGQFDHLTAGDTSSDSFTYTLSGEGRTTDTATVTITITVSSNALTAHDDSGPGFATKEDTAFTTGNVLDNDSPPNASGSLIVQSIDTTNTLGLVTDNGDGTFDYDPNGQFESLAADEAASDTFIYTVSDGNGGVDNATVTIAINGINDAPTAHDDNGSGFTTDEDTAFTTGNVLSNDTDIDTSDVLAVQSIDTTHTLGLVTDNGDGTLDYDPNGEFESLADGQAATDTFAYTVHDGNGESDTATITIAITGMNDAPTANDDNGAAFVTDEDTAFTTGNVLDNDADTDTSDTLSVQSIDTTNTLGLVTDNGDGTFDYDPNGQFDHLTAGETATDTFMYTVSDGNGGTDAAMVSITITSVNIPDLLPPGLGAGNQARPPLGSLGRGGSGLGLGGIGVLGMGAPLLGETTLAGSNEALDETSIADHLQEDDEETLTSIRDSVLTPSDAVAIEENLGQLSGSSELEQVFAELGQDVATDFGE